MRLHEPLLPPFAAVPAGLAIARSQQFPERAVTLAAAAIAAAAVIARLAHSKQLAFAGSLIALVFGAIALSGSRPPQPPPSLSVRDNVPAIFEGCVVDPALVAADRERFTVELAPRARAQVSLSLRPTLSNPNPAFPDLP